MWPEHQRVRYRGPAISSHQAARIAQEFVREHNLPIRRLSRAVHCRPIVYGREDDKLSGTWEVWFESSVPHSPPADLGEIDPLDHWDCDPPLDHPIIVYVDDQTGAATLHEWM